MTSPQNASLTLKLTLALLTLAIGIVITDLTGRALISTSGIEPTHATSLDADT
jgi:hypothetical protein